ncbi:unnamed protein product, partial [Rotaria sordida]
GPPISPGPAKRLPRQVASLRFIKCFSPPSEHQYQSRQPPHFAQARPPQPSSF